LAARGAGAAAGSAAIAMPAIPLSVSQVDYQT